MLKLSKVYKFENVLYYISNIQKSKKRNVYTIRKVNLDGSLGTVRKVLFKRNTFEEVKNVKIHIRVEMPRATKDNLAYNILVNRTKLLVTKGTITRETALEIAENAYASIAFYNGELGRNYSIKDFAKNIGLRSGKKLYIWIALFLKSHFTEIKYRKAIKEAADITIITCIKNYQRSWDSIYGYNKEINELVKRDFAAYMEEFKERGLSMR